MKSITHFNPISEEQIQQVSAALKKPQEAADFTACTHPYEVFGTKQLDNIYLLAEVTIEGSGEVIRLDPVCSVDQSEWWMYEDESDIRIDPVLIPFSLLTPQLPLQISGSATFLALIKAENNIWDLCKNLPEWIWNERRFEFMLSFTVTTADGGVYEGNRSDEYANKLMVF